MVLFVFTQLVILENLSVSDLALSGLQGLILTLFQFLFLFRAVAITQNQSINLQLNEGKMRILT